MKRSFIYLIVLCLMMTMLPMGVFATQTEAAEPVVVREPGMCGENLRWNYADGMLIISGSGEMDGFEEGLAPWQEYKDSIRTIVLSGNVTSVGACAFTDFDVLETVEFGDSLQTIGYRAFKSCDGLTRIVLPETFRKFDEECLMGCKMLGEIWCRGGMPSFKTNCVWDITATIFYPPAKAWPAEYVIPLGDAFRWQIQFQTMDVPEEYLNTVTVPQIPETVQTEPVQTEPPAEVQVETVPETTAAPTEAPTEAAAAATEAPETEPAPTQEETKPAWMVEMEQLEQAQEKTEEVPERKPVIGVGVIVGICVLSFVLLMVLTGVLVFGRRRY